MNFFICLFQQWTLYMDINTSKINEIKNETYMFYIKTTLGKKKKKKVLSRLLETKKPHEFPQ